MIELEKIKCPQCNESYYKEKYSVSTCVGYSRIFKDGKDITINPNINTSYCECLKCGCNFRIIRQMGDIKVLK